MRVEESGRSGKKKNWSLEEMWRKEEMWRGIKRVRERIWIVMNGLWEKNGRNWRSKVVERRVGVCWRRIEEWRRKVFSVVRRGGGVNIWGGKNMWGRRRIMMDIRRVRVLWIDVKDSGNVGG